MSKDIIVLTPNGRRQKVHCTPDTCILQVLEDVCAKQGFQPTEYDLKHHNHILDLTTTVRFSNIPNKATLEMVEAERKRQETNVTVGLLLEDGERRTADFPPNTPLYDLIISLAPTEFGSFQQPTILYMRQEVIGESALREKTLRQLGLIGGRAILRLLNKAEEAKQANVSAFYRKPSQPDKPSANHTSSLGNTNAQARTSYDQASIPGPSNVQNKMDYRPFDPIKAIKEQKNPTEVALKSVHNEENVTDEISNATAEAPMEVDDSQPTKSTSSNSSFMQDNLERRLKIEEEVTFLGAQKAVAFMQPEEGEAELEDLPDDFYDLTIEEVRRLYRDLQQNRSELENTPLLTASKREDVAKQTSVQRLSGYKNVVVRVQFPDHIILQGVFLPTNTIEDVTNFVKEHLQTPEKQFHIFTTPLKETLDSKMTLMDAKFVPCVLMHFKWLEEDGGERGEPCLKREVYSKKTSSDAASILASKYRAPSRRRSDHALDSQQSNLPSSSTAKPNKLPKWLKN